MSNHWFKFKQFTIHQDRCAMKVGTDAVLLGAWCNVDNPNNKESRTAAKALDIGSGTGIISMMIAQRNQHLIIDGIDVDHDSVVQAKENVKQSSFCNQISIVEADFTNAEFKSKYDFIISNPPYYEEEVFCPDENRNNARHTTSLPFDLLVNKVAHLLNNEGVFSVIIPFKAAESFITKCSDNKLYLIRRTDIYTNPNKASKRSLLAFSPTQNTLVYDALYIRNEKNEYTQEFLTLTKDFYLNN